MSAGNYIKQWPAYVQPTFAKPEHEFIWYRLESAMIRLQEWFEHNPNASLEQGSDELFAILMGRRDQ